jgi:superfamily I DNA/RNA helicase
MREATKGLTLREIIEHMLQHSGLLDFYRTDKEGQDRIENLEELVNAAEAFVTQEGFGKDAVALPVDEQGAARRVGLRARRRHRRDHVAAGGLPDARLAGGRRQPGPGRQPTPCS